VTERASQSSYGAEVDLPDYSADWRLPEPSASNPEIEARFYYEFARESETILMLTEKLSEDRKPLEPLFYLSLPCFFIVQALVPNDILGSSETRRLLNLREVSWDKLEPQQKENVIKAVSRNPEPAFRAFEEQESFHFDPAVNRGEVYDPRVGTKLPVALWSGSSLLIWDGIENIPIKIDWSQGPQAVKAAMKEWFSQHTKKLRRLKLEGKFPFTRRLPGKFPFTGRSFCLRSQTGANTPTRKYEAALRQLGAMRLLGTHTLPKAIQIAKDPPLYSNDPRSRSAWIIGIKAARETFRKLFYPRDAPSLQMMRRSYGLPRIEEPISYQRYCLRTEKNK